MLFAKTRNAVVVCALRAGPFFGTKRNRLVICVLHAVLLERGILWFLCSSHGAFRTRNTLCLCTSHSAFRTRNTQGSSCLCTSRGGFMVKKISLMTFMDRQHSLTTRFVFMVSAMNIHGSTNHTTRTNRRNTIKAQWCEVKNC